MGPAPRLTEAERNGLIEILIGNVNEAVMYYRARGTEADLQQLSVLVEVLAGYLSPDDPRWIHVQPLRPPKARPGRPRQFQGPGGAVEELRAILGPPPRPPRGSK